jgi:tetratricopeptide (TPR) repeat protein
LRVAYLLEGSVQKAGNQVLINVQLVDGRTDAHLWAQSYKRTLDDIFGVEGEVAQLVAEALHAELTAAEAAALAAVATSNKEALDAYLRGRHALRQSNRSLDPADLDEAIALARRAVTLDPRYADAWALLALAHFKRGGPNSAANAESAARRALAIDPDHYGGHVQLGFALSSRGQHEEAIAHGREAVRLRPSELSAQTGLAIMLAYAGQRDEAAKVFAHAARLDPQSAFPGNWRAALLLSGRDYAAARELAGTLFAQDPADLWSLSLLVKAQLNGDGDLAGARASLRRASTTPQQSAVLAELWSEVEWLARDFAAARRYLEPSAQGEAAAPESARLLDLARVLAAQGETEAARATAMRARVALEDRKNANPDDAVYQRRLARALSLAGEHALALRAAQRAMALQSPANNAVEGPASLLTLAQVHLRAGRRAEAVDYLRSLMALPAGTLLSARRLRLDPEWDALRGTPEFDALLREYPVSP